MSSADSTDQSHDDNFQAVSSDSVREQAARADELRSDAKQTLLGPNLSKVTQDAHNLAANGGVLARPRIGLSHSLHAPSS
jgi:hypothetical protein